MKANIKWLCQWLQLWQRISPEVIIKWLKRCCISDEMDGEGWECWQQTWQYEQWIGDRRWELWRWIKANDFNTESNSKSFFSNIFANFYFLSHVCNKMVKLYQCLNNWTLRHEGIGGSGCIDPHFLDLSTSWSWMVSFTPRPLYPREKNPRHQLDRMLGEPQSQSGRHTEEKVLDPTGTRTPTPRSSSP
jgi:hypothetical protein